MPGCDTTSGLKSKGKRIWWNTWNKQPKVTETFVKISQHPFQVLLGDDFASVEDFVCRLYDNTSTTSEVNVLRMNMFCQRSQDVQRIPPTQDALILQVRRAVYQASIWYTRHQPMLPEDDQSSLGWQESNNNLTPRWTSHGTATEVFKLTVKCG